MLLRLIESEGGSPVFPAKSSLRNLQRAGIYMLYHLCCVRKPRWLVSFSLLAIFSVVLLVIIGGPLYSKEYRSEVDHDPGLDANILWFDWLGSVAKIGSVVFNLSCAPVVLHAYTSMRPRSLRYVIVRSCACESIPPPPPFSFVCVFVFSKHHKVVRP